MAKYRRFCVMAGMIVLSAVIGPLLFGPAALAAGGLDVVADEQEAFEIGADAYLYAYPLVLMDVTRRVLTNVEGPTAKSERAPMNQFTHLRAYPDAKFTNVVRPNADTLYSTLWFDVTREPMVIRVPDSGGRYYLLPILDLWTDVFASPGTRTTGAGPQTFAIAGPRWDGKLPEGLKLFRAPTNFGWLIGRTQTNGKEDYPNVHRFQAGLTATPLGAWGKDYVPPRGKINPAISRDRPLEQVARMDAAEFFALFAELLKVNPPHANDYPILERMQRIGIEADKPFDLARATPTVKRALENAVAAATKKIVGEIHRAGVLVNNWRMMTPPIGTYGTDYLRRAGVAYFALGATVNEDAIYPTALADADGKPFDSAKRYEVHFAKAEIPPVRAFWSLTMYNDKQLFADNPIDRYAIGDRDRLKFNDDGSLTLFIQREPPGEDRESNWLPAPASGGFSMNLRLFWPKPEALDGAWKPPAVKRVER